MAIAAFDRAVDDAFDHLRGRRALDRLFYGASALGDHGLIWLAATVLRCARGDQRAALRLALTLPLESLLVNGLVKSLFRRSRPTGGLPRPLPVRLPLTSSFPSGHASAASCATVLLGDGDPLWPMYVMVAAVVSASRVHVQMHHASDVIGGALTGLALGFLVRRRFPLDGLPPAPARQTAVDGIVRTALALKGS